MIEALIQNDLRYMRKDPMMWAILILPIGMVSVYHIAMGLIPGLEEYSGIVKYLFLTMGGCIPGSLLGLRILDENDEHILPYFAVTPLTLKGYYSYRGMVSLIIGLVEVTIISIGITNSLNLFIVLYLAILSVGMTYLVGGVAKNKIQGMVSLKLFSLIFVLPCIRLFGENRFETLIRFLPWDYVYHIYGTNHLVDLLAIPYSLLVLGVIAFLYSYIIRK
ncbi:MAG TPA: hypothetical protein VHQ24_14085 [Lachnospiraceae bacterium]|nr:hypothetical protein [Lachnospiraceae bacterium]